LPFFGHRCTNEKNTAVKALLQDGSI